MRHGKETSEHGQERIRVKGAGDGAREVAGVGRVGPCIDYMVTPKIYVYALIHGICEYSLIVQKSALSIFSIFCMAKI